MKTKTVKYTWNKCGVCQAAHEQLRVKNSRGGSWESTVFLSFSPFHETSYSFQNTEVSWSLPLPRPPESSGWNAPLCFRARSALVFSHPPLPSVFFTRLPRSFVSVSFARLQPEEHRGAIRALNGSSLLRERDSYIRVEMMKNSRSPFPAN